MVKLLRLNLEGDYMEDVSLHINLRSIPIAKKCSLYRAVNWIAFKERPLDDKYIELAYPDRLNFTDYDSPELYYKSDGEILVHTPHKERVIQEKYSEEYKVAENALRIKLVQGKLSANGILKEKYAPAWRYHEDVENVPNSDYVFYDEINPLKEKIPKEHWDPSITQGYFYVDTILNTLTAISNHDIPPCETFKYSYIEIDTSDLMRVFPDSNSTKKMETRGRNEKYKWNDFYEKIILIADTPDGLPDKQADLEKEMAEWCTFEWDEAPAESTIRAKISPIYQKKRP